MSKVKKELFLIEECVHFLILILTYIILNNIIIFLQVTQEEGVEKEKEVFKKQFKKCKEQSSIKKTAKMFRFCEEEKSNKEK
jgi:hypothetical protein